jgi:tetratricopeptide (TPR) repeat protein
VLEFRGTGLVLQTVTGRKTTIPADKVVDIQTSRTTPHRQGDAAFEQDRYQDAAKHYQLALSGDQEQRGWVRRRILAALVRSQHAAGNHDAAGRLFVTLLRDDPASPYFDAIPLAWTTVQQAKNQQIAPWLADPLPAVRLLGASYALSSTRRDVAVQALEELTEHADVHIRSLATAQLWRTRIAQSELDDVQQWEPIINRLPPSLRAGPYFAWGQSLATAGQHERAALAQMRVRILYAALPQLSAEALLAAGKSLIELDQMTSATRVLTELIADFPETRAAAEAQQRLESLNITPRKPN